MPVNGLSPLLVDKTIMSLYHHSMPEGSMADTFAGKKIYLVGIKGTGMSALAELLVDAGADVAGVDTVEQFYTDEILRRLKIPFDEGFDSSHIDSTIDLVAHSAAYSLDTCPELIEAKSLGIPIKTYPQMLGEFSRNLDSTGIAGVHGKSTTTAMTGTLLKRLNLPVSVIAGTAVPAFGDKSTLTLGREYFVAETCEYRRHFLEFHPNRIVVTNVELDHTDYFSNIDDIGEAFLSYGKRLPENGELIYCADDSGASLMAAKLKEQRPDLCFTPYGTTAGGPFRIDNIRFEKGKIRFALAGFSVAFELRVPGAHNVLNAAASIALVHSLAGQQTGAVDPSFEEIIADGLLDFTGSRRRGQIVGQVGGVVVIDDYGHHPTAISKTLEGFRSFYPDRRIVVDFMPHLYSRTKDLFDGFITAFDAADVVILHEIYSSARETTGDVSGYDLYQAVKEHRGDVYFFEKVEDAEKQCRTLLTSGDVFITMGAGDNWKLGRWLLEEASLGDRDRRSRK